MDEEVSCTDIIYSEDYLDFILDYRVGSVIESPFFDRNCVQRINENYVVAYARKELFDSVLKIGGYRTLPKCYGILDTQVLETTGVLRLRRQPFINLYGQGVIVGIIDCGIDYQNEAFIWDNNTSKIVSVWVQDEQSGTPPEGFEYGREILKSEIDNELVRLKITDTNPAGINNGISASNPTEDINVMIDQNGHGTAMAALAAGREIESRGFSGMAPLASLAVVKLKQVKQFYRNFYEVNDEADAFLESDIMLGIKYLLSVSSRERKPLVICLGVGTNQGDHNGTGPLGELINSISGLYGIYMCTAAGNETGRKHHFRGSTLEKNDFQNVEVLVRDNKNSSGGFVMELWASSASFFSVQLKPPLGDFTGIIDARGNQQREFNFQLAGSSAEIFSEIVEKSSGDQLIHFRVVTPAQGIWTVRVIQNSNVPGTFDIWLPMEGVSASSVEFVEADPDITICEPGNAFGIITMGGSTVDGNRIYVNSSRGYTRNGAIKPDLVAPADDIVVLRKYTEDFVTGTSYASAITGGILAMFAEWSIPLRPSGTIAAKQYLIRGANTTNITVPDRSFGYGRVDIYNTFVAISE